MEGLTTSRDFQRKRQHENDDGESPKAEKSKCVVQSILSALFLFKFLIVSKKIDFLSPRDLLNIVISKSYAAQVALSVYSLVTSSPNSASKNQLWTNINWIFQFSADFWWIDKKLELFGSNDEPVARGDAKNVTTIWLRYTVHIFFVSEFRMFIVIWIRNDDRISSTAPRLLTFWFHQC